MTDIKFTLNRLTGYSDKEIIKELQRVAKLLNASSLIPGQNDNLFVRHPGI
jgi:hypothetical protein